MHKKITILFLLNTLYIHSMEKQIMRYDKAPENGFCPLKYLPKELQDYIIQYLPFPNRETDEELIKCINKVDVPLEYMTELFKVSGRGNFPSSTYTPERPTIRTNVGPVKTVFAPDQSKILILRQWKRIYGHGDYGFTEKNKTHAEIINVKTKIATVRDDIIALTQEKAGDIASIAFSSDETLLALFTGGTIPSLTVYNLITGNKLTKKFPEMSNAHLHTLGSRYSIAINKQKTRIGIYITHTKDKKKFYHIEPIVPEEIHQRTDTLPKTLENYLFQYRVCKNLSNSK